MISKKKIATYICSEFLKNTYKGKDETLELAIESILIDIFPGFEPPGNQIKWLEFQLQISNWQPYSKGAIFLLYINFMLFYEFDPT